MDKILDCSYSHNFGWVRESGTEMTIVFVRQGQGHELGPDEMQQIMWWLIPEDRPDIIQEEKLVE